MSFPCFTVTDLAVDPLLSREYSLIRVHVCKPEPRPNWLLWLQFSITVDGIYTQHGSAAGTIPYFISKVFYVGGIVHNSAAAKVESSTDQMTATGSTNFVGCLRKVIASVAFLAEYRAVLSPVDAN